MVNSFGLLELLFTISNYMGKKLLNFFFLHFFFKKRILHTHTPWLESLVVCQPIGVGKPNVRARHTHFNKKP
jgi:hypothetical protein